MKNEHHAAFLRRIKALLVDADGTLWHGKHLAPDLKQFIDFLEERGLAYTIATNNSVAPASAYQQFLAQSGINLTLDHILTVSYAAAAYLKTQLAP